MRNRLLYLLIQCLCFSTVVCGQVPSPVVTPPSPDAAAVTRYADFPNASYIGVPDISIPLLDYEIGPLNLKFGISYDAVGRKVQEEASSIGLGWRLDGLGVISRDIRGVDDFLPKGYYKSDPSNYSPGDGRDGSPDIFKFNFFGYTGRFLLNYNSAGGYEMVILNQVPLKIELVSDYFRITDDKGNVFVFSSKENTRKEVENSSGKTIINYISSWFLTTVTAPSGEIIQYNYNSLKSKVVGEYHSGSIIRKDGQSWQPCLNPYNDIVNFTTIKTVADQLMLSNVSFPNGSISFLTADRVDLDYEGTIKPKHYKSISGTSSTLGNRKNIQLVHSYFDSGSGRSSKFSKRLKLISVSDLNSTAAGGANHRFEYNEFINLPDKDSYSRDHWGFYNGQQNETIFAGREPSVAHVQANLLAKRYLPTGGRVNYHYEPNEYSNFDPTKIDENPPAGPNGGKIGPGCRISKIEYFDYNNISLGTRIYSYPLGKRMSGSNYTRQGTWQGYVPACGTTVEIMQTQQYSQANFGTHVGAAGYEIGYDYVAILSDHQGTTGKTETYFYNEANLSSIYPGVPQFLENRNGYVRKKIEFKKHGAVFVPVKKEVYTVVENSPKTVNGNIEIPRFVEAYPEIHSFPINSNWKVLTQKDEVLYDSDTINKNVTTENYFFDNPNHKQLSRKSKTESNGNLSWLIFQYPLDYSNTSGFIHDLKTNHLLSKVVEEVSSVVIGGSSYIVSGKLNTYKTGGKGLLDIVYNLNIDSPLPLSSFKFSSRSIGSLFPSGSIGTFSQDSRYKSVVQYNSYNSFGKPTQITENSHDVKTVFWGYQGQYPVMFVDNAALSQVAYTSFEETDNHNWSYNTNLTTSGSAFSGKYHYNLSNGSVQKSSTGATSSNVYVLTFWAKMASGSGNWSFLGQSESLNSTGWKLVVREVTTSSLTISGSGILIDELRLYPKVARMETYTYHPFSGITCHISGDNTAMYYDYDYWGRLVKSTDHYGKITLFHEYNYLYK